MEDKRNKSNNKNNEKTKNNEKSKSNKINKSNKTQQIKSFLVEFLLVAVGTSGVWLVCRNLQIKPDEQLRNIIMTIVGISVVFFTLNVAVNYLDFDNGNHFFRFQLIFFLCFLFALLCPYLPVGGWPYLAIYLMLSLFSNVFCGIISGTVLLMTSIFLSGSDMGIFFMYFISGVITIILFWRLDKSFRIIIPLLISCMVLITCETANIILFSNEKASIELFVLPVANTIVNCIFLLGILKLFSSMVIYRYRIRYMEITDPEYPLLSEFKEKYKQEYYQCMHTAYFCDRIAHKLGLDAEAVKTAGYYHKIDLMYELEKEKPNLIHLFEKNRFPEKAKQILSEYMNPENMILEKETAVLIFSDAVTASIIQLFSQNENIHLDYEAIIDSIFQNTIDSNVLKNCYISMKEITEIKKIFKEEKLYYDFLR